MKLEKTINDKTLDLIIHAVYLTGYLDGKEIVISTEVMKDRIKAVRQLILKESK